MSAPISPAAKTERLLNLVLCLLYTRTPLPKSSIRQTVPQYAAAATDEAFDRMFERDKDELRDLGIPLVTEELTTVWEDELGYRIDQRDYALPEIDFEPDEPVLPACGAGAGAAAVPAAGRPEELLHDVAEAEAGTEASWAPP